MNKASELGIWKIDKDLNIEFLPTFFEKFSNFEKISKTENENTISNFEKKFSKTEKISKTENNKQEFGKNLKFTEKHQEEQEPARVKIDNVECETSQDADKAHEIGQISENIALSAQNSADFAEFETLQTQENEQNAEIFRGGGENLTQINEIKKRAAWQMVHFLRELSGEEQGTAQRGAVALGLQKIAFSSSEKPAKMSIGEAYANWQRQIQAAAEFSVRGENLAQNDSTAWQGETSEANADLPAPQTPLRTGGGLNGALKTPKKQPKTAQTPEQTAAAMFKLHSEIAKSANFSDTEREAVLEWFAYKAEHKKYPLTERTAKSNLRQCVKIKGENKDLPEIIERTIANGWADLRWVADKPAQNAYKSAWQQQQEQKQASWKAIIEKYRPKNEQKAKGA